ncbi:YppG family protein [Bacillus sp. JJ1533]|uniref:YppG family protein n=1 Tax=Bacillus sp. JJ1533 TaxID=3122959 RepID=UPI003F689CA7
MSFNDKLFHYNFHKNENNLKNGRDEKMFYGRPRQPFPFRSNHPGRPRRAFTQSRPSNTPSLLSHFQTQDGKLDFNKITSTAGQMRKVYSQVSPLLSMFLKK